MKIFEIIDESTSLLTGVLLYYEKAKNCIIELPEYLDEWTAPLLFTVFVKKGIYTIPRDISFLWVKERVIPSGRQNIKGILNQHNLKAYDEMTFLEISKGKCSQDSLYIRKTDHLPEFVMKRQAKNIRECVLLDESTILCFFEDGTVRKIDLNELKGIEDLDKILNNQRLYQSGIVGTGGYFITFNNSIDISASVLYQAGVELPLRLKDFESFIHKNIIDTSQSCNLLECTRQNLSYMVKQKQLMPVKADTKGNLYLKGDLLRMKW